MKEIESDELTKSEMAELVLNPADVENFDQLPPFIQNEIIVNYELHGGAK